MSIRLEWEAIDEIFEDASGNLPSSVKDVAVRIRLDRARVDASTGGSWIVRETTWLYDPKGRIINRSTALTEVTDHNHMWGK